MRRSFYVLMVAIGFALAACGTTPQERGITGAGIGAAAGTIVGAVTGLTVLEGALIFAGVGGVTGLLTDESQLNLGEPIWKWFGRGQSREQSAGKTGLNPRRRSSVVVGTQESLAQLGYDPGPADGLMGPRTEAAIREYQSEHSLLIDGRPSNELSRHLASRAAAARYLAQDSTEQSSR